MLRIRAEFPNPEWLFPNAELAEDHVEQILDVDPAEQLSERERRHPQLLRGELLSKLHRLEAPPQCDGSFLKQLSLSLACDQAGFVGTEEVARERNQRVDQLGNPISLLRGDTKDRICALR